VSSSSGGLTVYASDAAVAACVVGHGAGAGQNSAFLVRFARDMAARGISTATFDFPYMAAGRSAPDPAPKLEASWRDVLEVARSTFGGLPLFIGGKSMGGRIASHVAAQGAEGLAGLFFLGYPLHPPGNPVKRRDAHLPSIHEPLLFVQGTRDQFGTADEIAALLPALPRATLHVVDDGDHSFKIRARVTGRTQESVLQEIPEVVAAWMRQVLRHDATGERA
jgi:predicted alpha/beta-hydrolase family hydrolase